MFVYLAKPREYSSKGVHIEGFFYLPSCFHDAQFVQLVHRNSHQSARGSVLSTDFESKPGQLRLQSSDTPLRYICLHLVFFTACQSPPSHRRLTSREVPNLAGLPFPRQISPRRRETASQSSRLAGLPLPEGTRWL